MGNVDDSNKTILRLQRELVVAKKNFLTAIIVFAVYTLIVASWIAASLVTYNNVLFWVGAAVFVVTFPFPLIRLCFTRAIRCAIDDDLAFEKNMLRYNK